MSIHEYLLDAPREKRGLGAITDRTLAGLRLLLSISAFLIILIDPTEPSRFQSLTHGALVGYILYSLAIYLLARHHTNFRWTTMQYVIWADVLWYSALMTLGTGTNAVFFFFFLFAIIAGSSRGGTQLGFTLTAVSAVVFFTINFLLIKDLELTPGRLGLRTVYMAALGYILAYWGGAEAILRNRLTFLKELSLIANPRFGVDRTIRQTLRKLLVFYHADYCFLLLGATDRELTFYCLTRDSAAAEVAPMQLREKTSIPVLDNLDATTAAFVERSSFWRSRPSYRAYDSRTYAVTELPSETAQGTADALNVHSFITAPLRYRERVRGRVLVGSASPGGFDIEDAAFLQQAADQVLPLIENMRIVDHLASDAAEEERRRIARSVHDRVIQPYLGLQLGLKALQQELSPNEERTSPDLTNRGTTMLEQLVAMTREGIDELRNYVGDLKQTQMDATPLVDSIRRFAEKFESATGIHVDIVEGDGGLKINDRLAAEVFQMTAEALSNVHRHTASRNVRIGLTVVDNSLGLTVENDASGELPSRFTPLSIFERAEALGARTEVLSEDGKTRIHVEVPL
jgi:signal transduction histidine kinase